MKIMKSDRLEGQLKEDKENSEIDGEIIFYGRQNRGKISRAH